MEAEGSLLEERAKDVFGKRAAGLTSAERTSIESPMLTCAFARWNPSRRAISRPSSSSYGGRLTAGVPRLPMTSTIRPSLSPSVWNVLRLIRAMPLPTSLLWAAATCSVTRCSSATPFSFPPSPPCRQLSRLNQVSYGVELLPRRLFAAPNERFLLRYIAVAKTPQVWT